MSIQKFIDVLCMIIRLMSCLVTVCVLQDPQEDQPHRLVRLSCEKSCLSDCTVDLILKQLLCCMCKAFQLKGLCQIQGKCEEMNWLLNKQKWCIHDMMLVDNWIQCKPQPHCV